MDCVACQPTLSLEFSIPQEYWSELQEYWLDLPHPGTEPESPASPAVAGRFFTTVLPGKPSQFFS